MKPGWIVVCEDRHADDEYFVCEDRSDALAIAAARAAAALQHYRTIPDSETYGYQVWRRSVEDCYTITVSPQQIREPGEWRETA